MKKTTFFLVIFILSAFSFHSCDEGGGFNIFTLEQDIQFGADFDQEIMNSNDYNVLNESQYADAYGHLKRIRDNLLQSEELNHADDFVWKVRIIRDDEVLNAFAVPGGYMYFYTGLIKYLDDEAQFAGVMAHEMTHADRRHSTQQMTKTYGFQFLMGLLLGEDPEAWAEIAADLALGLGALKFSRVDEYEADEYAVKYSADTELYPKGVAGFFEKIYDEENRPSTPEFLNTHPDPGNRIDAIDELWRNMGSPPGDKFPDRYQNFKSSLP